MCLWHRAVRTVRELMAQPAPRWTRERLCRAGRTPVWVYFNGDLHPFPRCSQPQQCGFSILVGPSPALIAAGPAPAKHLCLLQPGKPLALILEHRGEGTLGPSQASQQSLCTGRAGCCLAHEFFKSMPCINQAARADPGCICPLLLAWI